MLPHGPERTLEQVVHRFNGSTLHLRKAEENEDYADVGEYCVQKECTVAHLGNHVGGCSCDAVVDYPVDEEAEAHTERTLEGTISW